MLQHLITSARLALGTWVLCAGLYPCTLWAFGRVAAPAAADGSLVYAADGTVVGSTLVAQAFTQPHYLWPRPSAVDFDGAAAGGSNLAPSNPLLTERAIGTLTSLDGEAPVPAELVAASGSGLDPHVTLRGALYQAERIARARGVSRDRVEAVLRDEASEASSLRPALVNVLLANLALDREIGAAPNRAG